MSISSLPSDYGIGTFGKAAYDFANFLEKSGQSYWQMLPLGPVSYGDSPYQSFSSFAGNPYYIDLDMLADEGLLTREEINSFDWGDNSGFADYGKIYHSRFQVLSLAKNRGFERDRTKIEDFCQNNSWVYDYSLFMACKGHFSMKCWQEWPDEALKRRKPSALLAYKNLLKEDCELFIYIQFLFFKQWNALKEYIHSKGIKIFGDLPVYVAPDSADVWCEPEQFQLDEDLKPLRVAGCPPDDFSDTGQLWGNPLYNWEYMQNDGFGWWIRRIDGVSRLYDVIRIDHFRGFDEYWSIPCGDTTAENGKWCKGPGMALINVLNNWFPNITFIAEDLGLMTPSVIQLVKDSGWPNMKVMGFAFEGERDNDHLPHKYYPNCVAYTGTHDNETLMQWKENASPKDLAFAARYLNLTKKEGFNWGFIRGGMCSAAGLFIVPFQDYLELGGEARMNQPGNPEGWWRWRAVPEDITGIKALKLAARIAGYTEMYGRGLTKPS